MQAEEHRLTEEHRLQTQPQKRLGRHPQAEKHREKTSLAELCRPLLLRSRRHGNGILSQGRLWKTHDSDESGVGNGLMSLVSEMYPGLRREHDSEVGWRESYAKTNGFVASDPEICHSYGGTSPALARLFSGNFVLRPPRPPCAVIFCSLLTLLETYQSSLLGK